MVIAAIYETVIDPGRFDSFLGQWAEYVQAATGAADTADHDEPLADLDQMQDPSGPARDADLQAHFARAHQILEQMGRRTALPSLREKISLADSAMLAVNANGVVETHSRGCSGWLAGIGTATALEAELSAHSQQLLRDQMDLMRDPQTWASAPVVLSTGRHPRHLIARIVSGPAQGGPSDALLLIEALQFKWSDAAARMLVISFALSPAEVEIVRHLMAGLSLREIATASGKSEHTVRNQTKSILSKTGAPGQADLIRLVAYLINEETRSRGNVATGALIEDRFFDPTGKQVHLFRSRGRDRDRAVIFLHGMLDGMGALHHLSDRLAAKGYYVLAPLRPGFGKSAPVMRPEDMFDTVTEHVRTIIARYHLNRPVIVGHLAGGIYAHVLAHRLHDQVAGAVAISSGAPIRRMADISSMSLRSRVMAYTARYTPALLPAVLRAGIAMIESDDVNAFMDAQFPKGTHDRDAIDRLGVANLLQSGFRMSVEQGSAGFGSDGYWAVRDWSGLLSGPAAPVTYLHGVHDQVNRAHRIEAAMRNKPGIQVHISPDAGQLLLYEHPDRVFAAIDAFWPG